MKTTVTVQFTFEGGAAHVFDIFETNLEALDWAVKHCSMAHLAPMVVNSAIIKRVHEAIQEVSRGQVPNSGEGEG